MTKRRNFIVYTCIWVIALALVMLLVVETVGDARVVNYSGIVRGATQKLVKEELALKPNDALIERIDGIIANLETGEGNYKLRKFRSRKFQTQLSLLKDKWAVIKSEISAVRAGGDPAGLFRESEEHFEIADRLVEYAETYSSEKLWGAFGFLSFYLVVSIAAFFLFYRRSRDELEKSFTTDRLTGIGNRSGLELKAASSVKAGGKYVLVKLDVDDFKLINATYGFEAADDILKAIAASLSARFHGAEACARLDADDFLVLARERPGLVDELCALLREAVAGAVPFDTSDVTFAFGAYAVDPAVKTKTMLDNASIAHKSAKASGKGRVVWYDERLLERLRAERQLAARMKPGLANGEFQLYLQPKFNVRTMETVGAEALVRWADPGRGLLFPDSFIPLFEKNGAISDLDFYMLDLVCRHIGERLAAGRKVLPVSVNFSRVTVSRRDFYDTVVAICDKRGAPYRYVELELTESAFNDISDSMTAVLVRLEQTGFAVSMDDFGSGYSTLKLLNTLPINELKLDRVFLQAFSDPGKNTRGLIGCVVDLAHVLGLTVVCEGVETEAHVEFLRSIECRFGQGYYFGRPVPEADFVETYLPQA